MALRTVKVHEALEDDEFTTRAVCPVCEVLVVVKAGELEKVCVHYVAREHGCGGEVFLFEDGKEEVREGKGQRRNGIS